MSEHEKVRGQLRIPLLANVSDELGMGRKEWVRPATPGYPIVGTLTEPGLFPTEKCAGSELAPQQLLTFAKWRIVSRIGAITGSHEGTWRMEALDQVVKGRLGGPLQLYCGGRVATGQGPSW